MDETFPELCPSLWQGHRTRRSNLLEWRTMRIVGGKTRERPGMHPLSTQRKGPQGCTSCKRCRWSCAEVSKGRSRCMCGKDKSSHLENRNSSRFVRYWRSSVYLIFMGMLSVFHVDKQGPQLADFQGLAHIAFRTYGHRCRVLLCQSNTTYWWREYPCHHQGTFCQDFESVWTLKVVAVASLEPE